MQPGDTKTEGDPSSPDPIKPNPENETKDSASIQEPRVELTAGDSADQHDAFSNPVSEWKYNGQDAPVKNSVQPVSWSASEFIDHEKQIGWFVAVAAVAGSIALVIYLLTRDLVSAGAIVIVAILFAAAGARKPRTLGYGLDAYGIHIGDRAYNYSDFKSFAIMEEDAIHSIQLFQFKRFTTPISLYFPPEQEDEIVNYLGGYLPYETRKHDPIDRLMRKVRF